MLPLWAVSVDISAAGTCRSGRCQSSAMVLLEPSPPVGCRRTVPAPGEGRRYRVLDTARSGPSLEVTRVTCHVSPTRRRGPRMAYRSAPARPPSSSRLRRLGSVLAVALALGVVPGIAAAAPPAPPGPADLGPNVTVFDPSMPVASIQSTLDAAWARQVDNEMGTARYAFLFRPGTYGTDAQPLQIKVGYYTEVSGLGASPGDVVINGKVEVYNRCLAADNCIALDNFWRTVSNLTIRVNGTGQDGCRASANFWAVSQAVSMRRVQVTGGNLSLQDYCTAGPQFASGGFIADSAVGAVVNGSQQQWLTRNSSVGSWSNGVWNQVFAGVDGAPSEAGFPNPPYTALETTPVSREKPYLFVDAAG